MTEREQLAEVVEVEEFTNHETVNEYLHLGWILIGTHVLGYGDPRERQERTYYCLAWMKSKGGVHRPKSKYDQYGEQPIAAPGEVQF